MHVEAKSQKVTPINAEEKLKSKALYKIELYLIKVIPVIISAIYVLNTALSYFDIDWPIISYIASAGIVPWLFIMMASYLFHFCEYHRMFLWYILVNNLICWTDQEFHLPISDWNFFILHIIIAGIFMFLVLYYHQKCRKK